MDQNNKYTNFKAGYSYHNAKPFQNLVHFPNKEFGSLRSLSQALKQCT